MIERWKLDRDRGMGGVESFVACLLQAAALIVAMVLLIGGIANLFLWHTAAGVGFVVSLFVVGYVFLLVSQGSE